MFLEGLATSQAVHIACNAHDCSSAGSADDCCTNVVTTMMLSDHPVTSLSLSFKLSDRPFHQSEAGYLPWYRSAGSQSNKPLTSA